jgi:hypothetical protein
MRVLGDHRAGARPGGGNAARLLPFPRIFVMDSRTTRTLVTFRRPFMLAGLGGVQPAGSYTVRIEEERLDTLTVEAWRQTGCIIVLRRGGIEDHVEIDAQELQAALARDVDPGDGVTETPSPMDRSRRPRDPLRRGGRP